MAELSNNAENKNEVLIDTTESTEEVTTPQPEEGGDEVTTETLPDIPTDETEGDVTPTEPEEVKIYCYLKRDSGYVELNFLLDENYSTGSTYEDYLLNKWVLLTDEMVEFRNSHPGSSPREIIGMIEPPTPTPPSLNEIKSRKISEISSYDRSSSVNNFKLNGMNVWLDKETRVGLMNSINIEKAAGRENTVLWLGSLNLTINCDLAIEMLSALELYALACYNKTAEHKNIVNNLETIEEVQNYDYKIGYPEQLDLSTTLG